MAPTVSESLYIEVGRAAVRMGYPLDQRTGDDRSLLSRRLPLEALVGRLADLELLSGDAAIGLRIGRLPGPTLLESLPRVIGYQRLVADGIALRVAITSNEVDFHLEYADPAIPRALSDLVMASVRCFGSWLLGTTPPLAAVRFRYGEPPDTSLHEEIFGRIPVFGARQGRHRQPDDRRPATGRGGWHDHCRRSPACFAAYIAEAPAGAWHDIQPAAARSAYGSRQSPSCRC